MEERTEGAPTTGDWPDSGQKYSERVKLVKLENEAQNINKVSLGSEVSVFFFINDKSGPGRLNPDPKSRKKQSRNPRRGESVS